MFIELLKTVFLGIVEGITEWLPISSTGHLILADELVKLNVTAQFKEMFDVVIQLGAILAVIVIYIKKLWPVGKLSGGSLYIKKDTISLWLKVIVAVLPAAVIGIPLDDWMNEHFFNPTVVALALIVYGVLFIIIENRNKSRITKFDTMSDLSYKTAFLIGCFQVLSLIPGTSRSGSTILGAILIGTSRTVAAEFSFFLAIPVMFGASLLKLLKFGFSFTVNEAAILAVGMIVSFIVSILAIKFLVGYVKKKDFTAFGYYRIVLGVIVVALALFGVIN